MAVVALALLIVVQVCCTLPLAMVVGRRLAYNSKAPVMPPHPACASYGACGHCGARGGGECLL